MNCGNPEVSYIDARRRLIGYYTHMRWIAINITSNRQPLDRRPRDTDIAEKALLLLVRLQMAWKGGLLVWMGSEDLVSWDYCVGGKMYTGRESESLKMPIITAR